MEQFFTWDFWVHSTPGGAHVAAALAAMAAAPLIFLIPKGTTAHRALGYLYFAAMLAVNATALSMYELTGRPNLFHLFALVSLATVVPGIVCAVQARRTGRRSLVRAHYFFMAWSCVGLMAAFLSQILSRTPAPFDLALPGRASYWIASAVGLLAYLSLSRLIKRAWIRRLSARYGA